MDVTVHMTPRLGGHLQVHGSKNYTSRYVLLASLAHGTSRVRNPAPIDDAMVMMRCCQSLGARIDQDSDGSLAIHGVAGHPRSPGELDVGNAGAVARFLMAICTLIPEPTTFTTPFPDSLGRRPHHDLLAALEQLGARTESRDGRLPVTVARGNLQAGPVSISGSTSSQYLSALLLLAPFLEGETRISVSDTLRSRPLIRQTLETLSHVGVEVQADENLMHHRIPGPQGVHSGTFTIPGDWPAAAALLCAAAVTTSDITLTGLFDDQQGERAVLDVLTQMGAKIDFRPDSGEVRLQSDGRLQAVTFDGDQATDAVLSMVAAACFAQGISRFYNIENLRWKESDRISDYCNELRKLGVDIEERRDEILVHGNPDGVPGGAAVHAHFDHRLLMGAGIVALRARAPVVLQDIHHITKSYPGFFEDLQKLGGRLDLPEQWTEVDR